MQKSRGIRAVLAVLAVALAIGFIGSCNLLGSLTSRMSIDGKEYSLSNMYVVAGESEVSDNHIFLVYFTSRGLEWDYGFEGAGDYLYLRFSSADPNLGAGTYPAIVGDWPHDEMVGEGAARVGYDADDRTYDHHYTVTGGKVHVRPALRGYNIELELLAEDGTTEVEITGSYRGTAWIDRL